MSSMTQFAGAEGRPRLIQALRAQTLVRHDQSVAEALADLGELISVRTGDNLVREGETGIEVLSV